MLLTMINPREAFLQVKDSPSIISVLVVPPILIALTFSQYYVFYRVKMDIPAVFYTEQIDFFVNSLIRLRLLQYVIFTLFGVLLILLIFISGRWAGGCGDFKQGISVAGYVHAPNILGLVIITLLILFTPAVQTNILTLVGYPIRGQYKENIVISLGNYIGDDSNLTVAMRAYYSVPLNATISHNGIIMGATKIIGGEVNVTYVVSTPISINKTIKSILLNGTSLNYNMPLIMKNIFDSRDYCAEGCSKEFTVDLTLFLNNTYVLPVQENMSIPYIVTLNVFDANMGVKSYEITSSFYIEVMQYPDPQPLVSFINEKISPIVQISLVIILVWQFLLLAMALKTIHEYQWVKAILFVAAYAAARYLLLGFTI